jgi:hypothetical protein
LVEGQEEGAEGLHEGVEEVLDVLGVRDVSAVCDQSIFSHGEYPLNILEPRKTPKRSYAISRLQDNPDAFDYAGHSGTER